MNSGTNSSNGIPKVETSNIVTQLSATILYKLLQNVSQEQSNVVALSLPVKMELQSQQNSPVISVGKDEIDDVHLESVPKEIVEPGSKIVPTHNTESPCFIEKYINISATESVKMNPKKRLLQRHLMEKSFEDGQSDNGSETQSRYSNNPDAPFGRGKNGKPLTRSPFIPSYMDPKSGPFFCKVCGYKASGLHYRVMACEGCKGFFRRSVQKKLKYTCKMNNNCQINSDNRTKCQMCRWNLCLEAGMDVASVLSEEERQTKNDLIRANRQKRKQATSNPTQNIMSIPTIETVDLKEKNESDLQLKSIIETIDIVTKAFETAFLKDQDVKTAFPQIQGFHGGQEFTNRVTIFARMLPGMNELTPSVQASLLHSRCLDLICLCTALSYNYDTDQLKLPSGRLIDSALVEKYKHLEPLWHFAKKTSEYRLTRSEKAVLAGLAFLVNNTLESMEPIYNQLLAALDHLMAGQPLRNSKLLIVIFSDLQVLTRRLFELRAPLGHQMLFDMDTPFIKEECKSIEVSQQVNLRLQPVFSRNTSSSSSSIPISTNLSSSIFAFSYGDKQL